MSMFSICTAYVTDNTLDEMLKASAEVEHHFTRKNGVLGRHFFQCKTQKQVIWAATEWESEERHNDAAQMIMKTRRDDRIASIKFGPEPYFEIFGEERPEFSVGQLDNTITNVIVGHGLISDGAGEAFLKRRSERWAGTSTDEIAWLRVYHNTHHKDEFVFFWGFRDETEFDKHYAVDQPLEEYLFTGLKAPFEMASLAAYNQFVCVPLDITKAKSAVH